MSGYLTGQFGIAQSIAVANGNTKGNGTSADGLPSARLSDTVLQPGDEVEFIGLSARRTGSIVCQTTCLTEVCSVSFCCRCKVGEVIARWFVQPKMSVLENEIVPGVLWQVRAFEATEMPTIPRFCAGAAIPKGHNCVSLFDILTVFPV